MFLPSLPNFDPSLFLDVSHLVTNHSLQYKLGVYFGSELPETGDGGPRPGHKGSEVRMLSKPVSGLTVWFWASVPSESVTCNAIDWLRPTAGELWNLGPELELPNSNLIPSLSNPWTTESIKEAKESGICLPCHAVLRTHSGRSSFNLSRLNMTAVSESLFVSVTCLVLFLNSPVVRKGPCPSTHVHRSEELSTTAHGGSMVKVEVSSCPWWCIWITCKPCSAVKIGPVSLF